MHVSLKSIEGDQISQNVKVDERYNLSILKTETGRNSFLQQITNFKS